MKICRICGFEKDESEFYFRKDNNKLRNECKECESKRKKEHYEKNKNTEEFKIHQKQYHDKYYEENKEKINKYGAKYYEEHKEEIDKRNKENYYKNKEERKEYGKEYYEEHKKERNEYSNKYNEEHKEELKEKDKKRRDTSEYREGRRKYQKERLLIDGKFKIIRNLRKGLRNAFQKYSTTGKITKSKIYGIDYEVIFNYIGLCPGKRENYHIDHKFPLCLFNFDDPEQVKLAFAPENHQWLTKEENLNKSDKYDEKEFKKYLNNNIKKNKN